MKHLLLALALAFSATPAFSQFYLGLSGGTNLSFWSWHIKSLNTDIDYEPAMGWRAAVLGEWQINSMIGLRAEFGTQIKANQMTTNFIFPSDILSGNYNGSPGHFRENYQYWEGSLLAQFSPLKKVKALYVVGGVSAGRLDKAWSKVEGTEAGREFSSKSDIDLDYRNWNQNALAADFGLGGNIPLGANSKIKVEARYQYNFTEISKHENVDARVNSMLFNVGYLHRL